MRYFIYRGKLGRQQSSEWSHHVSRDRATRGHPSPFQDQSTPLQDHLHIHLRQVIPSVRYKAIAIIESSYHSPTSNTNADVTGPLKTTSQGPTNPSSQDHTIPNYTAGHIELLHTEDHLLHTGLAQMTKLKPFHQGFYADYSYHLHQIAQRTRPATMLHHSVFVPISHQLKPQRTLPDHKDDILNRTNHFIFIGIIPFHIGHPRTNPYHTITSSSLDVAAATLHYHEVRYFPFTLENPNNCRYGKPNHQKHPEAPMELHHMITSSGNIYHADHPESRHFVPPQSHIIPRHKPLTKLQPYHPRCKLPSSI